MGEDDAKQDNKQYTGQEPALTRKVVTGNEPFLGGHSGLPRLLRDLNSDDWRARRRASQQLIRLGEPAIPGLIESLGHKDADVRSRIIQALAHIGKRNARSARKVVEGIAETLCNDRSDIVREECARTISMIADQYPREVQRIRDALVYASKDETTSVSQEALWALRKSKGGFFRSMMISIFQGQREREVHRESYIDLTGTDDSADLSIKTNHHTHPNQNDS